MRSIIRNTSRPSEPLRTRCRVVRFLKYSSKDAMFFAAPEIHLESLSKAPLVSHWYHSTMSNGTVGQECHLKGIQL